MYQRINRMLRSCARLLVPRFARPKKLSPVPITMFSAISIGALLFRTNVLHFEGKKPENTPEIAGISTEVPKLNKSTFLRTMKDQQGKLIFFYDVKYEGYMLHCIDLEMNICDILLRLWETSRKRWAWICIL